MQITRYINKCYMSERERERERENMWICKYF